MSALLKQSPVDVVLESDERPRRIGMIALATDLTSERDARVVIPAEQAVLYVTRVANENPTTPENLRKMAPRLTAAAEVLLPGIALDGLYYSCTAASVSIGEHEVAAAIHKARPKLPVVTPTNAAVEAFAALGVGRIALLTPYLQETTQPMVDYFTGRGLDLVSAQCLGFEDDRAMARITGDSIEAAALEADCPEAEALFVSCTALPAVAVVERLEQRLGKPVVTSNQAGFWRLLHHAGITAAPRAPGRLFEVAPLESAA